MVNTIFGLTYDLFNLILYRIKPWSSSQEQKRSLATTSGQNPQIRWPENKYIFRNFYFLHEQFL